MTQGYDEGGAMLIMLAGSLLTLILAGVIMNKAGMAILSTALLGIMAFVYMYVRD